jgi:hypothetical protein
MSQPSTSCPNQRPEQRQRSGSERADAAAHLPLADGSCDVSCFRSEAFAEDLSTPAAVAGPVGEGATAPRQRRWPGFGAWGLASSLLGLGLAVFFGERGN